MADTASPALTTGPAGLPVGRRTFLGYLVAGSTLTVALKVGFPDRAAAQDLAVPEITDHYDLTDMLMDAGRPTYYDLLIEIAPDNRIRFEVPRAEVGQGVVTAAVMMLAEELDARVDDIDASLSPAEPHRLMGQVTGGSHSIRSLWDPIRVIAAELRARLITAGAAALGVAASEVTTSEGRVVAPDGRSVTYGEISEAAAAVLVPDVLPTPKPVDQHTVVGSGRSRLDARAIATGQAVYTQDLFVGRALPTVLALPPRFGATLESWDATAARQIPGVVDVVEVAGRNILTADADFVPPAVAVVAETFDIAQRARDALVVEWGAGLMDDVSDEQLFQQLRDINAPALIPTLPGQEVLEAEFQFPYVPHAPMEVMGAVADVRADSAEVWTAAKMPIISLQQIAAAIGLPEAAVQLHVMPAGGSFGRRLYWDAGLLAAQVSQATGRMVKLMFTRRDDMKFGRARPASINFVRATLGPDSVLAYQHHMASPEMDLRHGFGEAITSQGADVNNAGYGQTVFTFTTKMPYKVGATSLSLQEVRLEVPTAPYRVVYNGQFGTVNEMMISELAEHFGRDEVEYRRALLDNDRAIALLDTLAEVGQWGRPLPDGVAQGIGLHDEYKSRVGFLSEIDVRGDEPRVTKMTAVVDVGRVVNTTGLTSTIMGVAMEGVSLILRAGLHIDGGAIRESSYGDYLWGRMDHSPFEIDVVIMPDNQDVPGGAGELGVPAVSASIANAYARATGTRPRRFPILEHGGN
jgi:isoquinoline 1-oxidoreductase beta subunit